jgi:hypothetical protein
MCLALLGVAVLVNEPAHGAPATSNIEPKIDSLAAGMPDWDRVRATAASVMGESQAGTDPLVYFADPLGRQMGLADAASTVAAKKLPPALAAELKVAELADAARRLMAGLAAWNVAKAVQNLAWADESAADHLVRQIQHQATWAGKDVPHLASILASLPALRSNGAAPVSAEAEALYPEYAALLDAKYQFLPDHPDSWLTILEKEGLQAWRDRLAVWPDPGKAGERPPEGLAERYTASRLQPLLRLRLAQQGSELEAWAARRTYADWWSIHGWKDAVRLRRGLARLCGSWQWTIHNHQNHGEHKFTISFPSPGTEPTAGGLAEIVVLGDLVYLRWEGNGKVQEDSLLFSKEGQRLEGTFMNNAGGWGSITGKKTAACPKK